MLAWLPVMYLCQFHLANWALYIRALLKIESWLAAAEYCLSAGLTLPGSGKWFASPP